MRNLLSAASRHERNAAKAVFSGDEIPKELCFKGMESVLRKIEPDGYFDKKYAETVLAPSFEILANDLRKLIQRTKSDLEATLQKIKRIQTGKVRVRYTYNFMNAELWREFITLANESMATKLSIEVKRRGLIQSKLEFLEHLERLAAYLSLHPSSYAIAISDNIVSWKTLELDVNPEIFTVNNAFTSKMNDIKQLLAFIPDPDTNPQFFNEIIIECVKAGQRLKDPTSHSVPYIQEYEYFARYLNSKQSPIRLSDLRTGHPQEISEGVRVLAKSIYKSVLIDTNIDALDIVESFCSRALFDEITIYRDGPMYKSGILPTIEPRKLDRLQSVSSSTFCALFGEETPTVSVASEPMLQSLLSSLSTIHFMTNPIDTGFLINRINIGISGYIALRTSQDMQRIKEEELISVWVIMLIACGIPPVCDELLRFDIWKRSPGVSMEFACASRYSSAAVSTLLGYVL